jgi:hypothetical protein
MIPENDARDGYWQRFERAGEISFPPGDDPHELYLEIHTGSERYQRRAEAELGIELAESQGERTYVHARPYILLPCITSSVTYTEESGFTDRAGPGAWRRPVGWVIASQAGGPQRQVVGNAQAWFYPADQILVLWECEVFHIYGTAPDDPAEDRVLITAWEGFERMLLREFADARRIVTPGWEPRYTNEQWEAFLRNRGYVSWAGSQRSFVKEL